MSEQDRYHLTFYLNGSPPASFVVPDKKSVATIIDEWRNARASYAAARGTNDVCFSFSCISNMHAFVLSSIISIVGEPMLVDNDELRKYQRDILRHNAREIEKENNLLGDDDET